MPTDEERVDGILGSGHYAHWRGTQMAIALEVRRSEINLKRFNPFYNGVPPDPLCPDTRRLKGIADDYETAIKNILRGRPVNRNAVTALYKILLQAYKVVANENNALDGAWTMGLVVAFLCIPISMFQETAKQLKKDMDSLNKTLTSAKYDCAGAYAQGAINAIITMATIVFPPVGFLTKGLIVGLQLTLDYILGPDTGTSATRGSQGNLIVGQFVSSSETIEDVGVKRTKLVNSAGKAVIVVGFAFDVNEIRVSHGNITDLRRRIARFQSQYNRLLSAIKRHKPTLLQFQRKCKLWQMNNAKVRKAMAEDRKQLFAAMDRLRYPSNRKNILSLAK